MVEATAVPSAPASTSGGQARLNQFAALSTVFDALELIVYVADLDTHELLFINDYTAKTFGQRWQGRRCWEFLQTGQTGQCSFCTNHLLVRNGHAAPPHTWEFQNTQNRRWYLCIDQAIPWVDGRLVRMEAAVDITERKENESLREHYAGLVAHDLANPLNSMLLVGQVLKRKLTAQGQAEELELLGQMVANAGRMDAMIRDLHEGVRLQEGKSVLRVAPVDLVETATTLISLLAPGERERVKLRTALARLVVPGDPARLERLLQNLVGNALRHVPGESAIEVAIDVEGDTAVVTVSDAGPGIAAEHLPYLFDRSFRVPGTRAAGSGLGLYICRAIVEAHGGHIDVESAPGEGTRFTFSLPTL